MTSGVPIPERVAHAYVSIPHALHDLIFGTDETPAHPSIVTEDRPMLIRPEIDDVVQVKVWLHKNGWTDSEVKRSRGAQWLLWLRWRFTAERVHRGGTP